MHKFVNDKICTKQYNTKEAQYLLEEFAKSLAEINKYIERKEEKIILLENQLQENARIRNLLKTLARKLFFFVPNKLRSLRK